MISDELNATLTKIVQKGVYCNEKGMDNERLFIVNGQLWFAVFTPAVVFVESTNSSSNHKISSELIDIPAMAT